MSTHNPAPRSGALLTVTAVALILLPLIALAIKLAWPGWMLFVLLFVSPILVIGYVMQVIIAATGFLSARAAFRSSDARPRAVAAAWMSAAGIVVTAFFFVDGGDTDYGSAFMYLIGGESDARLESISSIVALMAAIVWVGGWGWLLVEWIVALVRRRRSVAAPA